MASPVAPETPVSVVGVPVVLVDAVVVPFLVASTSPVSFFSTIETTVVFFPEFLVCSVSLDYYFLPVAIFAVQVFVNLLECFFTVFFFFKFYKCIVLFEV